MSRSSSEESLPDFLQLASSSQTQRRTPGRDNHPPRCGVSGDDVPEDGLSAEVFDQDEIADGEEINFDTNGLPPTWDDGNGLDQGTLTNNILAQFACDDSLNRKYEHIAAECIPLDEFRKMYIHGEDRLVREHAICLLKKKIKVDIPRRMKYDKDHKDIVYSHMGMMGNRVGLDAVLPNMSDPLAHYDPLWTFKLTTDRRYMQFNGMINFVKFDPHGLLVYIGIARQVEHAYIMMVPRTAIGAPVDPLGVPTYKRVRPMDARSVRAVFMMLAYMLAKINYSNIQARNPYPKLDSDKEISKYANNILQAASARTFSDGWIQAAPQEYRDTVCGSGVPCAFSSKHGQNRVIDAGGTRDQQRQFWAHSVDLQYLSVFKVALAVHIQCSEVGQWDPMSKDDIIEEFGEELYNSADVNTRARIDLDDFPNIYDDDRREISIYTLNRVSIPRLIAIMPADGPHYCALLPNLPKCRSLFVPSFDDDDDDTMEVEDALDAASSIDDEDEHGDIRPCFTHTLGNWQVKGIITPLGKHVEKLNKNIGRFAGSCPPLEGSMSQNYNNFTHHTHHSAGQHIVQRGILTGVTAGAWATSAATQNTASKLFRHVEFDLLHKALEEQVSQVHEMCLRFENVFTIHINHLMPRYLDGTEFFNSVVEPLIDACAHPDVFEALHALTVVLKPQIYPSMLLWTAYPITVLMEEIWNRHIRPVLDKRGHHPSNTLIASNAPSLAYALMKRTFTSRALLEGYLPMFWDGLEISESTPLLPKLHLHKWPLDTSKEPLLALKRAQFLTYGPAHLAGYIACFNIQLHLACLLARSGASSRVEQVDMALKVLAEVIVDAFIQDVTDLVRKMDSFCQWEQMKERLNYGPDHETYVLLASALTENEDDPIRGLRSGNVKSVSIGDLAHSIHNICRVSAPLSGAMEIFHLSLAWPSQTLTAEWANQLIKFFTDALFNCNVHFFPNAASDGSPTPSTDAWTFVGNRPTCTDIANNNLETIGARRTRLLEEQGCIASQADRMADWSILECNIELFAAYADHSRLPEEWSYGGEPSIKGNTLMRPVYEWAEEHLHNPSINWWTRLAVALGFLFMKLAPSHVFCPDSTKSNKYPVLDTVSDKLRALVPATRYQSITIMCRLPWIPKMKRKGTSDLVLYFTQATVVILAWIDPSSPVCKALALNESQNNLITMFNSKHTAKGLGMANMVQLGVLEAQGAGILNSPKANKVYFARSDDDLHDWAKEVINALKRGPNAIYNLVLEGQFPSRPPPAVRTDNCAAQQQRHKEVEEVSDSEEERRRVRRRK
ncbi:hypothetical protein V8D89_006640 [Ganoderma adspersum]